MIGLLADNWVMVLLATLWLGGIIVGYVVGGRKLAIAIAMVGVGHLLYRFGRQEERKGHDQRAANIERRREDAYREIDDRDTTRSDAAERLRRNDY